MTGWKLRLILSLPLLVSTAFGAWAQKTVSGTVRDEAGRALPGVTVSVKGTVRGTTTDLQGNFRIAAGEKDVLVFSCIGLLAEELEVGGRLSVEVVMKEELTALEEIVVVGYGTRKRASLTGAVSTVSDRELMKAPVMSLSNVVGARIAGVAAVQHSGQPGMDNASLTMRGQGGIVYVIDGIRRSQADFNGIDPNEIESVSILKDASAAAVYGLDANGVFIVTTKQGRKEKMAITYTGSAGLSQNAQQQEWLDGPGYAWWYNRARELQGDEPVFTKEMVRKMREGIDGWGNTNWYEKLFGHGFRTHHNVSATGGSEKVRFFASIGYLEEKGNLSNFDFHRFNLRSNVEAKITEDLSFHVGVSGRIEKRDAPRYSANPDDWHNVPQQIIRAMPYVPETMEYEGRRYNVSTPTASSPVSPLGAIEESGYARSERTYFSTDFSLQYDAPWLKGLNFKFQGAYDRMFDLGKTLTRPFMVMEMALPNAATESLSYFCKYDLNNPDVALAEGSSGTGRLTTQTSLAFDRTFGRHHLETLLLAETREEWSKVLGATGYGLAFLELDELNHVTNTTGNGSEKFPSIRGYSGRSRIAGFVGRINYDYAGRYYVEATLRYDGSYLFGGMNRRWVALPAASAGWRINNERWFDVPWVQSLKLRAGVGKTASSAGLGPFRWRNTMGVARNAVVIGGQSRSAIYAATLGNPNLTWSQCLNYNLGLDAILWNGLLGFEFDTFYKYEYDKLAGVTGAYAPSIGGYYFSSANVNKCDYKGFDLTLTHRNRLGNGLSYGAKLIWSYAWGRWLKYAGDSDNAPEYQRVTGKQIGAKRGFKAAGLFQSEEEIANSPTVVGYTALPGYIKYRDVNGDGVITYAQDQGFVGRSSTPVHTGSLELSAGWKGFDVDLLFSWGLGGCVALTGQYTSSGSEGVQDNTAFTKPFYHGGNSPVFLVENCWTPEHTEAEFPRLEITGPSNNNGFSSTFWYRNGDYLRLKTAQVGWSFPEKWLSKARIKGLRCYIEGYNLLTFSKLTKYNIDPESPAVNNGYYPQQRTFALGLKLSL